MSPSPHAAALALACAALAGCTKARQEPGPSPQPSAAIDRSATAAANGAIDRPAPAANSAPDPSTLAGQKGGKPGRPTITRQASGTAQRLQAVSPVDARVVWASGLGGTYALTTDGGATWKARVVPGAEALQFRDVEGVSEKIAYLLSAGNGAESRIYKTVDGGETWKLQFQNQDQKAFYDCFAFWTPGRGLVVADSIDERVPVLVTNDGEAWRGSRDRSPVALPNEGAFAASGTCVATHGAKQAWVATSGAEKPRVLATNDGGETWTASEAPIVGGKKSAGASTVAFRDDRHGMLGGGDIEAMKAPSNNVARSSDGGKSWRLVTRSPFVGPIFGLSYALARAHEPRGDGAQPPVVAPRDDGTQPPVVAPRGDGAQPPVVVPRSDGAQPPVVVATGPGGTAWTPDEGDTWTLLDGVDNHWAVAFADERRGWLVGTEGRITKIEF